MESNYRKDDIVEFFNDDGSSGERGEMMSKTCGDCKMDNLEKLVPPLELCKLIPEGEFEDSAFVWVVNGDYQPKFQIVDKRKYPFIPEAGATLYPAPTLKEILSAIPPGEVGVFCCYLGDGDWSIGDNEHDLYVKNGYEGKSPEASALKWWLNNRGVK